MSDTSLAELAEKLCEAEEDAYQIEVEGHKVLVIKTPYGNAYSPYELISTGEFVQAAHVAAQAVLQEVAQHGFRAGD